MWPTSEKTIALLAQKQAGDDDAWNQLLDRHRKSLHRMIQLRLDRRIRQRVDVSDVLQDVLIEANRRIELHTVEAERTVTVDDHDRAIGMRELRRQREGHTDA